MDRSNSFLRRLYIDTDEQLLREAFSWNIGMPSWWSDMDAVFGPQDADDFIKALSNMILIGVFTPNFCGLIILEPSGKDVFAAHLCARRGTAAETLVQAAAKVATDLFDLGMQECYCWVAEKNRAIRDLCDTIPMTHEGIVMYRGTYKNKLIRWLRYSVKAQAVSKAIAA